MRPPAHATPFLSANFVLGFPLLIRPVGGLWSAHGAGMVGGKWFVNDGARTARCGVRAPILSHLPGPAPALAHTPAPSPHAPPHPALQVTGKREAHRQFPMLPSLLIDIGSWVCPF